MSFQQKSVSKDMSCMLKGRVPHTLGLGYEKVIKEKVSMADVWQNVRSSERAEMVL